MQEQILGRAMVPFGRGRIQGINPRIGGFIRCPVDLPFDLSPDLIFQALFHRFKLFPLETRGNRFPVLPKAFRKPRLIEPLEMGYLDFVPFSRGDLTPTARRMPRLVAVHIPQCFPFRLAKPVISFRSLAPSCFT